MMMRRMRKISSYRLVTRRTFVYHKYVFVDRRYRPSKCVVVENNRPSAIFVVATMFVDEVVNSWPSKWVVAMMMMMMMMILLLWRMQCYVYDDSVGYHTRPYHDLYPP